MKFHKDAEEIPTDPTERRELVRWVLNHPLWSYDITVTETADWDKLEETGELFLIPCEPFQMPYGDYHECLHIVAIYVNPENERIEEDDTLNTAFRVWVEAGGWYDREKEGEPEPDEGWTDFNRRGGCHDYQLDSSGKDLEEALLELGVKLKFYYGGTRDRIRNIDDHDCTIADDGYCSICGLAGEGICEQSGVKIVS